jgi:hypothetical protein
VSRNWSRPRAEPGTVINDTEVLEVCAREPSGPRARKHQRGRRLIVEYERPRVYLDRDAWEDVLDAEEGILVIRVRPRDGEPFDLALTASELEEVFGEVRESTSWETVRCYHFPRPPRAVDAFVVKGPIASEEPRLPRSQILDDAAAQRPGVQIVNDDPRPTRAEVVTDDSGTRRHLASLPEGATHSITYPFPLRAGVVSTLELPADLSAREAERIATFVKSLAVDDSNS